MRRLAPLLLLLVPVLAIAAVVAVGGWTTAGMAERQGRVIDEQFRPLLDHDMAKLLARLATLEAARDLDRFLHQAVIAEKKSLTVTDEDEWTPIAAEHAAAVARAVAAFAHLPVDPELAKAFADWQEKSLSVVERAKDPTKSAFARKSSNDGKARDAFLAAQAKLAQVSELLERQVSDTRQAVDGRRTAVDAAVADSAAWSARMRIVFIAAGGSAAAVCFALLLAAQLAQRRAARGLLAKQREIEAAGEQLAGVVGTVRGEAQSLVGAATGLDEASTRLSEASALAAEQTNQVSTSAGAVASGVNSVAAASEEMSASIGEIGRNAVDASRLTGETVQLARGAVGAIDRLAESGKHIDEVVRMISSVAQKTNLLALNATIEAASAGEAGRGFAVVAGEVKNLARQTAEATASIAKRVSDLQNGTAEAVRSVRAITDAIERINQALVSVSAAVEEQSATTTEISRGAGEAAKAAADIAGAIAGLVKTAESTGLDIGNVRQAAADLAQRAKTLQQAAGVGGGDTNTGKNRRCF